MRSGLCSSIMSLFAVGASWAADVVPPCASSLECSGRVGLHIKIEATCRGDAPKRDAPAVPNLRAASEESAEAQPFSFSHSPSASTGGRQPARLGLATIHSSASLTTPKAGAHPAPLTRRASVNSALYGPRRHADADQWWSFS